VLVGLRDYQDDKGDIIHKYTAEEARLLRTWGEIPADKASFEEGEDGDDAFIEQNENHELSMSSGSSDESDESEGELEEEIEGL